jgi:transcription elongation GreA/GreB family factor
VATLKEQLYECCIAYIRARSSAAEEAIREVQTSANEETKSSAGDKYETGRAMAQLEIEKNTAQLVEANKLMNTMKQIGFIQSSAVHAGSIIITNHGNYYLAISAGQFAIDGKSYFAISAASPIGKKLLGMTTDASFDFNGKEFKIHEIL